MSEQGAAAQLQPGWRRWVSSPRERTIAISALVVLVLAVVLSNPGKFLGIPPQALFGQLLLGLINGAFYAMLSLGLAVIFGLLNIINFTHGAQYMMGAFCAWFLLSFLGVGYWPALIIAPIVVGAFGIVIERAFLHHIYKLDHLYGLLLTFGLALIIEGLFRQQYGSSGQPYAIPSQLQGGQNLGFMFLPNYRGWVIAASLLVCIGTWYMIERTRLGAYLRAATENPVLVQAFGINVPRMITLTYGFGVGLAALAGVMAAPIYQVSPLMGSNIIVVVFAVVVIGGMGSILGAVISGFALGLVEGLTKVFWPEASSTVIFVIMAIVLLLKPAGLFGRELR
jgi:branched-chain amino acid transport system permease protein